MEIRTKAEFYELWNAGRLGNRLKQFDSARAAHDSDVKMFGLREVGRGGGGKHEVVSRREVLDTARRWDSVGRRYQIGEAAPDDRSELQGEVCYTERGWVGTLGVRTGMRMREAIQAGLHRPCEGLIVKFLLDHFMDPSSRDDLDILLEQYPEATVEFCTYPVNLGIYPFRNTIFWEVRNY